MIQVSVCSIKTLCYDHVIHLRLKDFFIARPQPISSGVYTGYLQQLIETVFITLKR